MSRRPSMCHHLADSAGGDLSRQSAREQIARGRSSFPTCREKIGSRFRCRHSRRWRSVALRTAGSGHWIAGAVVRIVVRYMTIVERHSAEVGQRAVEDAVAVASRREVIARMAGILTVVPALGVLGMGFRLGEMVWGVWLGIVWVHGSQSAAARKVRAFFKGTDVARREDESPRTLRQSRSHRSSSHAPKLPIGRRQLDAGRAKAHH
jgi:hypothetical protein